MCNMITETRVLISALNKAADDIHDPQGLTSATMREAAERLTLLGNKTMEHQVK